jgi:arylsulfatase A
MKPFRFTQPLAALLLCFIGKLAGGAEAIKPKIVCILADDLGYGDVKGYYPQSKIPTPNLDRRASQGMRFRDAHAPDAVCTPTRHGLLTGRYSFRSRMKSGVLRPWGETLIEADKFLAARGWLHGPPKIQPPD